MNINEDKFREEITEALGLEKLSQERQDILIDKAVTVVLERIFLSTMEKLGESGMREYEAMLEREAEPQELELFFEAKIPGYNAFVQKITDDFKTEMKSSAA